MSAWPKYAYITLAKNACATYFHAARNHLPASLPVRRSAFLHPDRRGGQFEDGKRLLTARHLPCPASSGLTGVDGRPVDGRWPQPLELALRGW